MPAVPIYVWNGTAWQETGPTIPASPIKYQASAPSSPSTGDIWVDSDGDVDSGSQQFQRFRFVASGGETTESGADANGAVLAYTPGAELVVLNGSTLVRGQDYTATNGTSITGLSPALVANDVLEVFSFIAFSVANTYTQSQVDGLIAGPAFSVYRNGTQSVAVGANAKIQFNTEVFDTHGCFDSTTDYRFTPTVAGYYQVSANVRFTSVSGAQVCNASVYKNGANYGGGSQMVGDSFGQSDRASNLLVYMNGSTDYLEVFGSHTDTSARNVASGATVTWFTGVLVRRA
jgi:hypothetical protein